MQFGSTLGEACLTFIITNIDDAFVLVTFFAEAATSSTLTPLRIALGQYVGFTVITAVSLIGYAVAVALPSEPIGFLGLLPLLLGVWRFFGLLFPDKVDAEEPGSISSPIASAKSVLKVAVITVMNGGDNIGTYVPLFSQAKGAEIAIYVVVYYILLAVLLLIAFLIMKQKYILRIAEKYASFLIPFLYIGLGIYIIVKSDCYPWTIQEIDDQFLRNPGQTVMGVITTFLLSSIMGIMVWVKMRKQNRTITSPRDIPLSENTAEAVKTEDNPGPKTNRDRVNSEHNSIEQLGTNTERAEPRSMKGEANTEQLRPNVKLQQQATTDNHSEIQAAS